MLRYQTHLQEHNGEKISTTDKPTVNDKLYDLKLYGKSVQNGTPTPESPVSIQSVPSELDITSCGKNLFNKRNNEVANGTVQVIDDYVRCTGNITTDGIQHYSRGWYRPNYSLPDGKYNQPFLKSGDIITISADIRLIENRNTPRMNIYIYSKSASGGQTATLNKDLPINEWVRHTLTFTITSSSLVGKNDFFPVFTLNSNIVDIKNIAIKYGTDDTYTPHQSETKNIQIKDTDNNLHELCSLPDGTADEVKDGKIIEAIFEYVVDHTVATGKSIGVVISLSNDTYTYFRKSETAIFGTYPNGRLKDSATPLCDKVVSLPNMYAQQEGVFLSNGSPPGIQFKILNSRAGILAEDDATARRTKIITWLESNPLTVQLAWLTPIEIPLHPDELEKLKQVKSVYPQTNIFTSAVVEPTINVNLRHLGNRPFIEANLVDELGNSLAYENGNNIIGVY